jgi:hypothetical protein
MPSFHRKAGSTWTVPPGGTVPLLVKIAGLRLHGPLNAPRWPLTVVHAPIWNCVIRRSTGPMAGPGSGSGYGSAAL